MSTLIDINPSTRILSYTAFELTYSELNEQIRNYKIMRCSLAALTVLSMQYQRVCTVETTTKTQISKLVYDVGI